MTDKYVYMRDEDIRQETKRCQNLYLNVPHGTVLELIPNKKQQPIRNEAAKTRYENYQKTANWRDWMMMNTNENIANKRPKWNRQGRWLEIAGS